jgi:hypothetical protein
MNNNEDGSREEEQQQALPLKHQQHHHPLTLLQLEKESRAHRNFNNALKRPALLIIDLIIK